MRPSDRRSMERYPHSRSSRRADFTASGPDADSKAILSAAKDQDEGLDMRYASNHFAEMDNRASDKAELGIRVNAGVFVAIV